jgi:hypothetical protein
MSEQPPERPPEEPPPPETPVEPAAAPAQPPVEPAQPPMEPPRPHPIQLVVNDDLKRSRLTVFSRLLLAIPQLFWLYVWSGTIGFLVIVQWFAVLIKGHAPDDLHALLERSLRYLTHFTAYLALVGNPYPTFFGREGTYPVDLLVEKPTRQNRWVTGFRLVLAIPALILAYVFATVMWVVAFIGWFVAIVIGRTPKGMRDLSAYCLRYQMQTNAYLMIVTDRYPSLAGPPPPNS